MSKIHLLDKVTQNQIAAGEVIEKPSSVLKELIENSIDAKCKNISIELKNGGKTFIRIIDDGEGISPSDLKLAPMRYATSKLRGIEDLNSIESFGFRGEALASIAAVSKLTIVSQNANFPTTKIVVSGGKEKEIKEVSTIVGTDIKIEDLFFNTPARKKFLKSDQAELRNCIKIITELAMLNFEIGFKVIHDSKILMDFERENNLLARIKNIYPKKITNFLVPVSYKNSNIRISGFVSKPEGFSRQKAYQTTFVNKRNIRNPLIYKAIMNGYKTLLINGLNPVYIMNLEINTGFIDVNVHPQKKEIRINSTDEVYRAVYHAVNSKLFKITNYKLQITNKSQNSDYQKGKIGKNNVIPNSCHAKLNERGLMIGDPDDNIQIDNSVSLLRGISSSNKCGIRNDKLEGFDNYTKIVGQIHNSYIICETEDEFWLVDQHAAHERILYEEFKTRFKNGEIKQQKLMIPITKELTLDEVLIFEENKDLFRNIGFEIDLLDEKTIILEAIPDLIIHTKIKKDYIDEIFNDIKGFSRNKKTSLLDIVDRKIKTMACRAAVKFGDKLEEMDIRNIIDKLSDLKIPYCPHGRPAIVKMSWDELNRLFKRIF